MHSVELVGRDFSLCHKRNRGVEHISSENKLRSNSGTRLLFACHLWTMSESECHWLVEHPVHRLRLAFAFEDIGAGYPLPPLPLPSLFQSHVKSSELREWNRVLK